jgi:serine/threonine protein kinase
MTCTSCSRSIPEGSRFCPHCAAPAAAASLDFTRTSAPHGISSSSEPSDHGRFLPGTMLGGRYRVVALLGRGGMGEVYRADDLKLGQAVALKFLPAIVENDAGRLQRFLNEVKIARQISHPNVCRVYDVGEVDGHHYLSME